MSGGRALPEAAVPGRSVVPVRRLRLLLALLLGFSVALAAFAQGGAARSGLDPRQPSCGDRGRDDGWPCAPAAVSPDRRRHILDGDARGGGHRPGTGIPNKSEFPRGWSDDRIIAAIEDVANDPASARRLEADGRTVATGRRDGVDIRVVVGRDGRSIVTGYPTNTPRNPR